MNNERWPPARMEIQIFIGEKQSNHVYLALGVQVGW